MRALLFSALVLAGLYACYFLFRSREPDRTAIDLARREARGEVAAAVGQTQSVDLSALTNQGKGQDLPGYLRSELDPSGDFYFVGHPKSEMGVEIPFAPGRVPFPPSEAEPIHENPGFLGASACRSCHQEKYDSFVQTAHHRTSRLATGGDLVGSFEPGENTMSTAHPDVTFKMVKRDQKHYQQVSFFDWKFEVPIHLAVGSGKMAESYLYWHGDQLFQMNCTWLSESNDWINSPGFLDGDAAYARPIPTGCLDCHVTYVDFRRTLNHYTPKTLIPGVSCERCHGPGRDHVQYHEANPDSQVAKHVSVPSDLSRAQQLDLCGQCHTSNRLSKDERAFTFRPGDRLADHYDPIEDVDTSANSVHTNNQVARLSLSECFQQSEMACVECHNPHQLERGNTALFSERCQQCHQPDHCGMSEKLGSSIAKNCIDCHMPKRATEELQVETAEGNLFPPLRDHYIRVDQEATAKYLQDRE